VGFRCSWCQRQVRHDLRLPHLDLTLQDQAYTSAGKCHCLSFREIKHNTASEFFGRRSLTDPSESVGQTEPGRFGHIEPYWGIFDGVADDGAIRRVQVNDRRNQRVIVERGNTFEAELRLPRNCSGAERRQC
jgi:hypothetical protein